MPDGSSALAVLGHDLHLDHQGLIGVLGPAVGARLTGSAAVVEEIRISDVAAWQGQRLDDGVLGVAVAGRLGRRWPALPAARGPPAGTGPGGGSRSAPAPACWPPGARTPRGQGSRWPP